MKCTILTFAALVAFTWARPGINSQPRLHARDIHVERGAYMKPRWNAELQRREVPQEHSHEKFLTTVTTSLQANNPAGIVDSVFGLLGDAAASAGQGTITDTGMFCTAIRFTNANSLRLLATSHRRPSIHEC